jgi:hypothetical protein
MFIKVSTESETQDERIGGVSIQTSLSPPPPAVIIIQPKGMITQVCHTKIPLGGRAYYRTVGTKGVTRCHDTTNGEPHNFDQPPTQTLSLSLSNTHTHTNVYIYICIYTYTFDMCVYICVCVCVCVRERERKRE